MARPTTTWFALLKFGRRVWDLNPISVALGPPLIIRRLVPIQALGVTPNYPRDKMVGTAGFAPAVSTPPAWRVTELRYVPKMVGVESFAISAS